MFLKAYTGNQVQVVGEAQVNVSYGKQKGKFTLYVVKGNDSCLLGYNWLKHIHLDWKSIASLAMKDGFNYQNYFLKSTTWYSRRTWVCLTYSKSSLENFFPPAKCAMRSSGLGRGVFVNQQLRIYCYFIIPTQP